MCGYDLNMNFHATVSCGFLGINYQLLVKIFYLFVSSKSFLLSVVGTVSLYGNLARGIYRVFS